MMKSSKHKRTLITMINVSEIKSVYSGSHGCMCGCRGKHSDSKRAITILVNKLNKMMLDGEKVASDVGGSFYFLDTDTRSYVLYR